MDEQRRARLLALLGVGAMLALPVAAEAVPGKGKDGEGSKQGGGQRDEDRGGHGRGHGGDADEEAEERSGRGHGSGDEAPAAADPAEAPAKPAPPRGRSRGHYNFRGTVVAVDSAAGTLTLSVVRGNRHARAHAGRNVIFSVTSARFAVADRNADGALDLADLSAGDRLRVMARVSSSALVEPVGATRITGDRSSTPAPAPEPEPDPEPAPEPTPEPEG